MSRPIEHLIEAGETIKLRNPGQESVGLRAEGYIIYFNVSHPNILFRGREIEGVSSLDVSAKLPGLIENFGIEAFRRLALSIRLPDTDNWFLSFASLYGLMRGSGLHYPFFENPNERGLPVYDENNPDSTGTLRQNLPALVVPVINNPIFEGEQSRGYLAIKRDKGYQREIEIKFGQLGPNQIPTIKYSNEKITPFITDIDRLWGEDWEKAYRGLSTQELIYTLNNLLSRFYDRRATLQEVDYARTSFLENQMPIVPKNITRFLYMLQADQIRWIRKELKQNPPA